MVKSMNDESFNSCKESVEATKRGEGLPTFDEVCLKADLTEEQTFLFSTFKSSVKRTIQVRSQGYNGGAFLRSIADDLEVLFGKKVSGAKHQFVQKLFGTHALPQVKKTHHGCRIRPGSDELWSSLYELDLIVNFVHAGYSIDLEPKLPNNKVPEFIAQKERHIYVEAKRLDSDRQMDIIFDEDPSAPSFNATSERVKFTPEKERKLANMIFQNVNNASNKFKALDVPHVIFIYSGWPPTHQGNAIQIAISEFFSVPRPRLIGIAIEHHLGNSFWTISPEGIRKTNYDPGSLPLDLL